MSLTREQILAARSSRKPIRLHVEEWGGEVYIRVLSAADQASMSNGHPESEMPIRLLVKALVDEAGQPIFTDDDVPELSKEDFPVIFRVFAEVAKLNGLSTKELEEAMSSFGPTPERRDSTE
jgi:hypothetical protein